MTDIVPRAGSEVIPPIGQDGMAGLVHDLGNYIQIAMSAVRLMSRHADIASSDALGSMLAQAEESLERAGALVRGTLGVGGDPSEDEVSLDECVMQMAALLRYATGPDIRIRLHVGLVPKVRISRIGLQNALLNLAINARDAMPEGGTLSISALLAEGPDVTEVEIVVADDGIGMAPAVLARAFEPRFSTKPTGGGMGLAGVKRFVEAAGGRIGIDSRPGAGTSVSVRLPVGG
jgi:signal transduction histidine kinase